MFTNSRHLTRWLIIIASFFIISLILWNTYVFFQYFKEEQRAKMDLWASAHTDIYSNPIDDNINPVASKVFFESKIDNPMVVINDLYVIRGFNKLDSQRQN